MRQLVRGGVTLEFATPDEVRGTVVDLGRGEKIVTYLFKHRQNANRKRRGHRQADPQRLERPRDQESERVGLEHVEALVLADRPDPADQVRAQPRGPDDDQPQEQERSGVTQGRRLVGEPHEADVLDRDT